MSHVNQDDVTKLLEKWSLARDQIADLEVSIEKYKRLAAKIMTHDDTNSISSDVYTLKKRDLSRQSLARADVPSEVWTKYAKSSKFSAYYLTKNK